MTRYKTATLAALTCSLMSASAMAGDGFDSDSLWDVQDADRWLLRMRAIAVSPDESSSTSIGGHVTADTGYAPELDITYFFTPNIAAELIAATTNHDMGARNTALGNVDLGDVWVLPPTLTLQYHFNPEGQFRPYIGAGVNYMLFYGDNAGAVSAIDYENGFGVAAQVGMDIGLDENWALNFDVKKLWNNVDVKLNGGAVTADVDLDPWVVGVGLAYRF